MAPAPLLCKWDGEALYPVGRYAKEADAQLVVGENYKIAVQEERSGPQHRFYFAALHEAWANLPEDIGDRYADAEALRKWALIKTGYADKRTVVCASKAEAQRIAAFIQPLDRYAIVVVSGPVVEHYTAESQSMKAMGKERFQASVDAVLGYCASLVGVSPKQLEDNAARAA